MVRKSVVAFFGFFMALCFVGTGFSEPLTPQLCKEKVMAAAKLLASEGDAAIPKIKAEDGEFRFAGGEGYIWIHNLNNIMVMHPIKPSLDGKALGEMRDVNGVYLFTAMNETVETHGSGWIPYAWPKPGQTESSPKISYCVLVKHGEKDYVAGAGMYDVTAEDIKKLFPEDAIYED
ncbi:MAG: cache domain-containing protein [Proteobacteria bacterium]|nr:cache domain-containing protein [Pseudomonadota bacterium]